MQRSSRFLFAALLAVGALASHAAAEEAVRIPGTHVSLVPPAGFELSKRFPGVQDELRRASITVSEVAGSQEELVSSLRAEALEPLGLQLQESDAARFGERVGQLVRVEQTRKDVKYEKWMALVGSESKSIFVIAMYPASLANQLRAEMRASVLSSTWDPERELDVFDGLSFRLSETEKLKIVNRSYNQLILSTPGAVLPVPATEPFLIVADSFGPMSEKDIRVFSRLRIAQVAQISELREERGRALEVDGRPAYELIVDARSTSADVPLRLYQLLVAGDDSYTVVQGQVPRDRAEQLLPEFEAVVQTLSFP